MTYAVQKPRSAKVRLSPKRVWSKYSCGLAMVVFQQASQSLSAAYRAGAA